MAKRRVPGFASAAASGTMLNSNGAPAPRLSDDVTCAPTEEGAHWVIFPRRYGLRCGVAPNTGTGLMAYKLSTDSASAGSS